MNFEEYRKHDAVGLAGLVSNGEVSPSELLETAVARMAAVNPKINAVTMDLTEWGRQDVKRDIWAGPMAGVPFLLKDLGAQLAGSPPWRLGTPPSPPSSASPLAARPGP